MYANNEIGVIQPIAEIGKLCQERGVLFHTDAIQAVGKVPVDVHQREHRPAVDLRPQDVRTQGRRRAVRSAQESARADFRHIDGGGHERGMRSGTLNVPGIVGLGKACEIAQEEMAEESCQLARSARPSAAIAS